MKKLFIFPALAVMLCGCSSLPWVERARNLENSESLRVGMTKEEVVSVMGEPLKGEAYNQPDVWYYYITTRWYDGLCTEDECMPLVFRSGKLIGWGNEFYARMRLLRSKEEGTASQKR